jgi:hypothetical protein
MTNQEAYELLVSITQYLIVNDVLDSNKAALDVISDARSCIIKESKERINLNFSLWDSLKTKYIYIKQLEQQVVRLLHELEQPCEMCEKQEEFTCMSDLNIYEDEPWNTLTPGKGEERD